MSGVPAGAAHALQVARRAAGLSQEELAELAAVSSRTVRSLESGRATRPHRDTLVALGTALGLAGDDLDAFVTSWRGQPRNILELFDEAPTEQALRDALAVQRHGIREQAAATEMELGADRRWKWLRTRRNFEIIGDGVDSFLFAQGEPGGQAVELDPDHCVDVSPLDDMAIQSGRARAFLLSLGRPHARGEQCAIGYQVRFAPAPADAPFDTESLFVVPGPLAMLTVQVRFHPDRLPSRVRQVRQAVVGGPAEDLGPVELSPFGVAHTVQIPVGRGVHGIRWEW